MKVEIIIPEKTTGKAFFVILEGFTYLNVIVPAGFVTDGVSSGRILHSVFPPIDTYFLAAVIHDYLLQNGHGWEVANYKFEEGLKDVNVPFWKRVIIMTGVNIAATYYKLKGN